MAHWIKSVAMHRSAFRAVSDRLTLSIASRHLTDKLESCDKREVTKGQHSVQLVSFISDTPTACCIYETLPVRFWFQIIGQRCSVDDSYVECRGKSFSWYMWEITYCTYVRVGRWRGLTLPPILKKFCAVTRSASVSLEQELVDMDWTDGSQVRSGIFLPTWWLLGCKNGQCPMELVKNHWTQMTIEVLKVVTMRINMLSVVTPFILANIYHISEEHTASTARLE
jgi:hypothetical protein